MGRSKWIWYQEWKKALFLHWQVPQEALRPMIPKNLEIDTINAQAWVSLVVFTMEGIRAKHLPSIPIISNFHECNLRTYVVHGAKAGVYFLDIRAENILTVFLARMVSGLPYAKASIRRQHHGSLSTDTVTTGDSQADLKVQYDARSLKLDPSSLDLWLTERYCLYLETSERLHRYDIEHQPWPLRDVHIESLKHSYSLERCRLTESGPDLCHFSDGVVVYAEPRVDCSAAK